MTNEQRQAWNELKAIAKTARYLLAASVAVAAAIIIVLS